MPETRRLNGPIVAFVTMALTLVLTGTLLVVPTVSASASAGLLSALNRERTTRGLPALARASDLDAVAQRWTQKMAASGDLAHNPKLSTEVKNWRSIGENVGYGGSEGIVHTALMNSAPHRANMLSRDFTQVGIGVVRSGSYTWVTQVFRKPTAAAATPAPAPARPGCPSSTTTAPSTPRRADGPAVHRQGLFFLRMSSTSTACVAYGSPTDVAVMGDWDGDGSRTPGVRRGNMWYLRNDHSGGGAHIAFAFGSSSDVPVVGDWNGDGVDTIGVRRGNMWYLRDSNRSGPVQHALAYGRASDDPVVGDWNRDGRDTPGVIRGNIWYLSDSLRGGGAHYALAYGRSTDVPVVGDWDGDGRDTPGVFRSGAWYLKNDLAGGAADASLGFGTRGDYATGWR